MNEESKAQRYHDTDHGSCEDGGYSACWCCCMICDPDWGHGRPSPYYTLAMAELRNEITSDDETPQTQV